VAQAHSLPKIPVDDGAGLAGEAPATPRPKPPQAQIDVRPYSYAAAHRLETELDVSHALAQILVRRGLGDPGDARAWLRADEEHPAGAFEGMTDACALILGHVERGSRITVHGDYDVDGVTSTTILVKALRALGAGVDWFLPSRSEDGYGLSVATVEKLVARGTNLLITVDCGITSVDEVAAARLAGLDVLVTDHHAPRADGALPAAPIIHPVVSGYPCTDLCAAGVAYKLAGALASAAGADPARADEDLDLVALATLADVVPLRGENRRLVRAGLRALAVTPKPGLRALMRVSRLDPGHADATAVAFRLAPRINAAGRMHRADAGVELLLTTDEERASAIAEELDSANAERRSVEQRMTWEAEALVAEQGERSSYVLAAEGWHPGVIGIVASRIAERWHRPAVLIALDGDAAATGSGRSIPGFDLLEALHAAAGSLERYGGHRAAAGLTVLPGRIPALRDAVEAHAAAALEAGDLFPRRRVDAVVAGPGLGLALADELGRLEPCGAGNPGVSLLVPSAQVRDVRPMGEDGKHARFSLESGAARARAVAFGCDGKPPGGGEALVDAVVRLECHEWNGAEEPRLIVRDARPVRPAPIRVLGEPEPGAPWLAAVLAELDAPLEPEATGPAHDSPRTEVDRRSEGPSGVLADLVASGEPTLAVCADVPRRHRGLAARLGGFALCSWQTLAGYPSLAGPYAHVVALDPPTSTQQRAAANAGAEGGFVHLAWGPAELRFSQQILEQEFGLRTSLAALYRSLRDREGPAGEELEAVLRGDGTHARSATMAGRGVRVLSELGLVSLDRDLPALAVVSTERTELERSPAFRAYAKQLEDGKTYLKRQTTAAE
jgi:single-stranded-DNA-specific exonuclease